MAEIPTPTTGYSAPSGGRPLGVTILAILQILGGLFEIFGGMVFFLIPILGWLFGGILLILGVLAVIIGWGLWSMKSWAWMAAIILNILSIIMAIASYPSIDYLSIIIALIIILYLQQKDIKSRFR